MQQRLTILRRALVQRRGLVGAVSAAFDEAEIADVARQRGLGDVEPRRAHTAPQLLLTADRRAVDDVDDGRLAAGFHIHEVHDGWLRSREERSSRTSCPEGFVPFVLPIYNSCLTDYAAVCINILFPQGRRGRLVEAQSAKTDGHYATTMPVTAPQSSPAGALPSTRTRVAIAGATGYAGQVSLGHAFFMGVGAYTAVYLGGESRGTLWGHGLPMWLWLPGAGRVFALAIALGLAEYARGHVLTGLPWNLLGYGLLGPLPLMQLASLFGVYALSLIAVLVFACPAAMFAPGDSRLAGRKGTAAISAILLLLLGLGYVWGEQRLAAAPHENLLSFI